MSTNLAVREGLGAQIERVLIGGDLSQLKPEERVSYYKAICESVGLNPLTKPLEYITLNGKLTLYARKDATDQLRAINQVSIAIVAREVVEGCYVVTARATLPSGRQDESIGAVPIDKLVGEARSNALMKCETKAKRRVTLSICGMGMLDESEIDAIPGAKIGDAPAVTTAPKTFGSGPAQGSGPETATDKGPVLESKATPLLKPLPPLEKLVEQAKAVESEFIDNPRQINLAKSFRESLQKEFQHQAETLRHDWLARHDYIDKDGNPTSSMIKRADFEGVKSDLCAWGKKYRA